MYVPGIPLPDGRSEPARAYDSQSYSDRNFFLRHTIPLDPFRDPGFGMYPLDFGVRIAGGMAGGSNVRVGINKSSTLAAGSGHRKLQITLCDAGSSYFPAQN